MTFSSDLNRIIKKTNGKFDRLFQAVTMEVLTGVVELSPVGNPDLWIYNRGTAEEPDYVDFQAYRDPGDYVGGRFRGNWQLSKDSPAQGEVDDVDANGKKTITKGKLISKTLNAGEVSYVVNNLPYAERLENGWSTQAPKGMVKRTQKRVMKNIKKEADRLNKL